MRISVSLIALAMAPFAFAEEHPLIDSAFAHMYNCDFAGAHRVLDQQEKLEPAYPLTYSVRAAAYLFGELDRLRILQTDFFMDDDKVSDHKKLKPDPNVRAAMFQAIAGARQRANARLATKAGDVDSLFALCMSSSVTTDYTVLVERRQLKAFTFAKETHEHAKKLLALQPPFYDAYLTEGSVEYVIACMPFFLRWLVRFDNIQGNKEKADQNLRLVAEHGRYYKPFAKILMAVVYLREKQPRKAYEMLLQYQKDYPNNPLVTQELALIGKRIGK